MKQIFIIKLPLEDGKTIKNENKIKKMLDRFNNMSFPPHRSGNVTLLHNGIIENYNELKKDLIEKGYSFTSNTDIEVISATLDDIKKSESDNIKAINHLTEVLEGVYGLGIFFDEDFDTLYVIRKNIPINLILDNAIFNLNNTDFEITNKKRPLYTANDKIKKLCKKKRLYK